MIGGRYLRNCVAMADRKWITYPCSFKLGYVCGKRAGIKLKSFKHLMNVLNIENMSNNMRIYGKVLAFEI